MFQTHERQPKIGKIRKAVLDWSNRYPVDVVWRRRYNVRFGSPEHLAMDFPTMLFQLIEDYEFLKFEKKVREENPQAQSNHSDSDIDSQLSPDEQVERYTIEDFDGASYVEKMSQAEIAKTYEELDVEALNKKYYNKDGLSTGSRIQSS